MNYKNYTLILFFVFCYQILPQDLNNSILIEVPFIKTNTFHREFSNLLLIVENEQTGFTSGFGIHYSWRFPFIFRTLFEIRPGIFISDPYLMGVDLGIYIRQKLYKNLFVIIGSNIHYNFGFSEGQISWKRSSLGGLYFSPGASLGYSFSQRISTFLGYHALLKNNWRESWSVSYRESSYSQSAEKLFWIIKLGMEFNF
ncbi:MAG: hypothetical protein GYA14_17225 [Ignavibacteria bacterium]|nr:hypothetical protein [Ignavibacteria bacterium]